MTNLLHEFKFYTTAKVCASYIADYVRKFAHGVTSVPEHALNTKNEQLYPTQQGVYTFKKTDPITLLKSNKMLIDQTATILALDERAFNVSMLPVIRYLANYCLKLPASRFYHHVQPGSLFFHLLETGNEAAQRAKTHPELMMHTDPSNRTDYELVFPTAAFLLGILHDIAKPMTDMEVIPLDKKGQPISTNSWQPDEETLFDFLLRNKANRYKLLYRETREYHQHDAYRLWFIGKLLSFFPRETGIREQLKHVIPVHAAAKHPLNYIVSEADRISTKRDTQRYRPFPSVTNLAKAFVDVFQDYDMVKRIDDQVELPYFFSDWAIHVPFPEAVRVLVNQVNIRYSAYTDIPLPSDPDSWANLLGAEHGLLVANARAKDYRSLKYPDINLYVYYVVVNLGTDQEDRIRVLSLSREHIALVKDVGGRLKDVKFATQVDNAPQITQQTKKTQVPAKSRPTKSNRPSKAKVKRKGTIATDTTPSEPSAAIQSTFEMLPTSVADIDFEVSNDAEHYISPPPLNMPPLNIDSYPITGDQTQGRGDGHQNNTQTSSSKNRNHQNKSKRSTKPNIVDNLDSQVDISSVNSGTQVKAEIEPLQDIPRPPLAINLSALGDLVSEPKLEMQHSKEMASVTDNNVLSHPQTELDSFTFDEITPYKIDHEGDIELGISRYLKQMPTTHVLSALFNDAVIIYDDETKLILWALYNDLQQYDLTSLFTKKHREYQVLPEGLALNKSDLEDLLSRSKVFDEIICSHLQSVLTKLVNTAKTDVYKRLFNNNKKRGYRFINNDITQALLYRDRKALIDYFSSALEEEL